MAGLYRYLIIVAGGKGLRMGSSVPKQFLRLGDKPVIIHTIQKFIDFDPAIELIVVLPDDSTELWEKTCLSCGFDHDHSIIKGGKERFDSVKNGLSLVRKRSLVAIHDAVRPLVSKDTIERCFKVAGLKGNAVPFVRPAESVRDITEPRGSRPVNRDSIALIQTPQVFRSDLLLKAYEKTFDPSFTDDASVVEAAGYRINLVEGNRENIKITTALDMIMAEAMMDQ